ncbi:rho gtpase-activating protein 68f [Anaeramoeba flamelloides]|uniref:Rho gtpase-activating protein 68f n=1 Tax=Anaeramoeba flamelloides TaxID=1746091 RepID=A0AAV7ZY82_9EUKA|nr:rho gtpase-activating protein 68f [Anaeramoeba flamelloides]
MSLLFGKKKNEKTTIFPQKLQTKQKSKSLNTPTIDNSDQKPVSKTTIFGVELSELMKFEENDQKIPLLVEQLFHLILTKYLKLPKLFQKPVSEIDIMLSKEEIEKTGRLNQKSCSNGYLVAELIKIFLKELPDPLLTAKLSPKWIKVSTLSKVFKLIKQLPRENFNLLHGLVGVLKRVYDCAENKKNILEILNSIFAPLLIQPIESTTNHFTFVKLFIKYSGTLFDPNFFSDNQNSPNIFKSLLDPQNKKLSEICKSTFNIKADKLLKIKLPILTNSQLVLKIEHDALIRRIYLLTDILYYLNKRFPISNKDCNKLIKILIHNKFESEAFTLPFSTYLIMYKIILVEILYLKDKNEKNEKKNQRIEMKNQLIQLLFLKKKLKYCASIKIQKTFRNYVQRKKIIKNYQIQQFVCQSIQEIQKYLNWKKKIKKNQKKTLLDEMSDLQTNFEKQIELSFQRLKTVRNFQKKNQSIEQMSIAELFLEKECTKNEIMNLKKIRKKFGDRNKIGGDGHDKMNSLYSNYNQILEMIIYKRKCLLLIQKIDLQLILQYIRKQFQKFEQNENLNDLLKNSNFNIIEIYQSTFKKLFINPIIKK